MAIGQVLHELEVKVSASEAWDLYGSLELAKFVEQALPNLIEKVELIQGDGGVGTILKLTFASGNNSLLFIYLLFMTRQGLAAINICL